MKKAYTRILSCISALSLAVCPVLALDGAEAAMRFRQAAQAINREGLIAETAPITEAEILESCSLLEAEPDRLYEIVNRFLARMDSHSMYLAPVSYSNGYASISGYAGIGVVVRQTDGGYVVDAVTPHSPAADAGVQPGDRLKKVDRTAVGGLSLEELTELLRGTAGTRVSVTVQRGGETLAFDLVRTIIRSAEVTSAELAKDLHYIAIDGFASMYTPADFAEALEAVDPGDDLILDLRGNGGGAVDYALQIADELLTERTLMCTMRMRADQGGRTEIYSEGGGLAADDLIVLVDGGTASAAELLAGILREAGGAVLVGGTTYGKGQGQYHLTMSCGDKLVITALEMELIKSGCWEGAGLAPDVAAAPVKMADALRICSVLDTETAIRYGEQSRRVRALTERLVLLGYLAAPTDTFTTPVLSAVRAFQEDAGLTATIGAYPETLRALSETLQHAVEGDHYTDTQLTAAMVAAAN